MSSDIGRAEVHIPAPRSVTSFGIAAGKTGRKMRFTGITILKVVNGKIVEENGLDDGVTALTQLGILRKV